MSEKRKTTVEQMKVIGRQDRLEHRSLMTTTVLAAAAVGLFALPWTSRCPLTAAVAAVTANPTSAPAEIPAATQSKPGAQAGDAETVWLTDFDRALAIAKRLDRPGLIDFVASQCVPCQMMEKHVWPQEIVRKMLSEHVVPLKVDMDAAGARTLAQRYSVQFLPAILLVNSRGEQLDQTGYVSADELIEFVNEAR